MPLDEPSVPDSKTVSAPAAAAPRTEEAARLIRDALNRSGTDYAPFFAGSTEQFVEALAKAYANLLAASDRVDAEPLRSLRSKLPQPDHYGFTLQLLWDACNALLAAALLLQRGYETEPLAIARGVLERVACAIVLFDNPHLRPRFKAGILKDFGTKSINAAKVVVPQIGFQWGLLSQVGSHVGIDNVGTGFVGIGQDAAGAFRTWAVGGRMARNLAEEAAKREVLDEFTGIAEQLLDQAPAKILFSEGRVRASYR